MRRVVITLLVALLVLLAGCPGSGEDVTTPSEGTDTPTTDNEAGGDPDVPEESTAEDVTPHGENGTADGENGTATDANGTATDANGTAPRLAQQ